MNIQERLKVIEKKLQRRGGGITVEFCDGTRRTLDACDCVGLVRDSSESVTGFSGGGSGSGRLVGLLNGLLT